MDAKQAAAVVEALRATITEGVATKANLERLRAEIRGDTYRALLVQTAAIVGVLAALFLAFVLAAPA